MRPTQYQGPQHCFLAFVLIAIVTVGAASSLGAGELSLGGPPMPDPYAPNYFLYQGETQLLAGYYPGIQALIVAPQVDPDEPLPTSGARYYEQLIDTLTDNHINLLRVVLTMGMALEQPKWLHPYDRTPSPACEPPPSGTHCTNHARDRNLIRNRFIVNEPQFNDDFFAYWNAVIQYAEDNGLIVQVSFFDGAHHRQWTWPSSHVNDPAWPPLNYLGRYYDYFHLGNNTNHLNIFPLDAASGFEPWYEHAGAKDRQKAFIDKAVYELGHHNNVIWELINEGQVPKPSPNPPHGGHPWFAEMRDQVRASEDFHRRPRHMIMPFDSPDHTHVSGHTTPGTQSNGTRLESDNDYKNVHHGLVANFGQYLTPILADNDCCAIPGNPDKLRKKAWTSLVSGAHPNMLVYNVTGSSSPRGLGHSDTLDGIRYTGYVRKMIADLDIEMRGMSPRDDLVAKVNPSDPDSSIEFIWALAGNWAPAPDSQQRHIVYFFKPGTARILGVTPGYEAWWFNPKTGVSSNATPLIPGPEPVFQSPNPPQDWVLYISEQEAPPQTMTLTAIADAYVDESNPATNRGSTSNFSIQDAPTDYGCFSFLKFNIPSFSGSVTSAKLRIRTKSTAVTNLGAYKVNNMSWSESGITYENWDQAGAVSYTYLSTSPFLAANTWHYIDVTPAVTGSGTLNLGLASGTDQNQDFWSHESSYRPRLYIYRAGQSTLLVNAAADSCVSESQPSANFGNSNYLRVRYDPTHFGKFAFIKFQVPSYSGTLLSAKLRIRTQWNSIPSAAVYRTSGMENFNENTINWSNWDQMGAVSFTYLATTGALAGSTWHEIDVTSGGAESGATLVLGLATTTDQSGLNFWSREISNYAPELVLTYQP